MTKNKAETDKGTEKPSSQDTMLHALEYLCHLYGMARSSRSLLDGLPFCGKRLTPALFVEAAERSGLKAQIVRIDRVAQILDEVLPCVLIDKAETAFVLLGREKKMLTIYNTVTKQEEQIDAAQAEKTFAGYAIYISLREPELVRADHEAERLKKGEHWFWSQVRRNSGIYALAMIGAVFINLFGLASPLFVMNVYDRVIPNNAIETGWALGIGALIVFSFDLFMRVMRGYLIDLAGRRIEVMAGQKLFDHLLDMRIKDRPASSGMFANMLRDFDSVREFFASMTITTLVDMPFTLFFLFIIFQIGGPIAFVLGGLIAAVVIVGFGLQFSLKVLVQKSMRSSEAKHGLLIETIHALETIKTIGADARFRAGYMNHLGRSAFYAQGSRFISALGVNIASFLQQIATVLVVLTGMYMIKDGDLTVGGLIACVILGGKAISPVGQIANLMTRYHQSSSSLKTLQRFMNAPTEREPGKRYLSRPDLDGSVRFENVVFSYPQVDRQVLQSLSFQITAGERVGIIGRNGSGKSTIARLMLNLYQADSGSLYFDNTDSRQIDPADLKAHIGYISQDIVLFRGTVRDNIIAGQPRATEAQILEAAKQAGVHEFISAHPMGYDAPVGENGDQLSGGQKQAIALARAIIGERKLLICDEPTNALDMQTEAAFMKYLQATHKDRTLVLITHKHNLMPLVDRLILVDRGRVIMDGARESVLRALQNGEIKVQA